MGRRGRAEGQRGHDFFWSVKQRGHDFFLPVKQQDQKLFWSIKQRGHDFFYPFKTTGSGLFWQSKNWILSCVFFSFACLAKTYGYS